MDIIETIKSFFGGNKVEIIDGIEFKGKEIKALHRYKEKLNERLSVTKLYIREKNIESEEFRVNLLNKTRIIAVLYCFNTELDMKKLKCVDEIIRAMDNDVFMKYIDELKECNSIELTSDNKVALKHITKFLHYNSIEMPKEISSEEDNKDEDFIELEIENPVIEEKQDVVDESMGSENENNNDVEVIEEEEIENIAEKEEDVEENKGISEKEEEIEENKDVLEKEEEVKENKEVPEKEEDIKEKETKSEKKENRTVTKLKEENEEIKEKILIALKNKNDFITIKEIRKDEYSLGLSQCTSQKISALIRQLVEDGKVERVSEKKVIRFKIK